MEDNYQKGSRNKNKQVIFEEADDESEEEAPAFVRIGPLSLRKIREVPYVDVPSLTPVVRADRPRPKETEGPAYTTRVPIEKEEFGQEVLEEVLNASLDVIVRQLLGTAPSVRKELIKQLVKVRCAPSDEPNRAQYKATVEDVTDEDEPKKPIERIIKEKIESGKYNRKSSSYKLVNLEDIIVGIGLCNLSHGFQID